MPDLDSRSVSFCSMVVRVAAGMMLAASTTRPVSSGRFNARATESAQKSAQSSASPVTAAPPTMRAQRVTYIAISVAASEFDLRRRLGSFARGEFRHRLIAAKEYHRPENAREGAQLGVVDAHGLDVVAARNR